MAKPKGRKNKVKNPSEASGVSAVVETEQTEQTDQPQSDSNVVVEDCEFNQDVGVPDRTDLQSTTVSCDEMRKFTSELSTGEGVDTSLNRVEFQAENVVEQVEDTIQELVNSVKNVVDGNSSMFMRGNGSSYSSLDALLKNTRSVNSQRGFFAALKTFATSKV